MDWADRADIATRLREEEIPNDVADHAGYIADEVNLLAAQRTYELRRLAHARQLARSHRLGHPVSIRRPGLDLDKDVNIDELDKPDFVLPE